MTCILSIFVDLKILLAHCEVYSNKKRIVRNVEEHGNNLLIDYAKEGKDNDGEIGHRWESKAECETPAMSPQPEDKMNAVQKKLKAGVVLEYTGVELVQIIMGIDGDKMSSINHPRISRIKCRTAAKFMDNPDLHAVKAGKG